MARTRKTERGFSLIELLVVVVIILVIVGIAIPNIVRAMEAYRLRTSASMIVGRLTDARINAIKRNRRAWLRINAATGQVQVQMVNPAPPPPALDLGGPSFLATGISIVPAATPPLVAFDSLGRPTPLPPGVVTPPPYVVTLRVNRTPGVQSTVTVSPTGRMTVAVN